MVDIFNSDLKSQVALLVDNVGYIWRRIQDIDTQTNALLGGKIFQLSQGINTSLVNLSSYLSAKLQTQYSAINNSIQASAFQTQLKVSNATMQVTNSINGQTDLLLGKMQSLSTSLNSRITQEETRIISAINNITGSNSSSMDYQTLVIKQGLKYLSDTISKSVNDLPKEIANEIDIEDLINRIEVAVTQANVTSSESIGSIFNPILQFLHILPNKSDSDEAVRGLGDIFYKLTRNEYHNLDEVRADLDSRFSGNFLLSWALKLVIFTSTVVQLGFSIGRPFALNVEKLAAATATPNEATVDQLMRLLITDNISEDDFKSRMREIGYNNDATHLIERLRYQPLDENYLRLLHFNNLLPNREIDRRLGMLGYNEGDKELVKDLWNFRPNPRDLIEFAIKDVYDDRIVNELGLMEDIPDRYIEEAKKTGLSEEYAKLFWAASWRLPSIQQGYEMLHRNVINQHQLDLLFKAQDIVPFWRENLIKISYAPYTRVDARRMHKMGVLNNAELLQAYKDIGYDDEKAQKMLEWTIEYNNLGGDDNIQSNRDLTRALIIKAYKLGINDRDNAIQQLVNMGYAVGDAETIVEIADIETGIDAIPEQQKDNAKKIESILAYGIKNSLISEADYLEEMVNLGYTIEQSKEELSYLKWEKFVTVRELLVNNIKKKYIKFIITKSEAASLLGVNNFERQEVEEMIALWDIDRDDRTSLPTKTELEKFVSKGLITYIDYVDTMRGLGYDDKFIGMYIDEMFS